MSDYIIHSGQKGQQWHVRRYQNPDGTWTELGKERRRQGRRVQKYAGMTDDVNDIFDSLPYEKKRLAAGDDVGNDEKWIDPKYKLETTANIAYRYVEKVKDIPVSFIEVWNNSGDDFGEVAIVTRQGYEGHGYASKGAEYATKWFDKYGSKNMSELRWHAFSENSASIAVAKKSGFVDPPSDYPEYLGVTSLIYRKKKK